MIKIENKLLNFHKRYDAATDNGPQIVKIETNMQKGMESKTFLQNTSVKGKGGGLIGQKNNAFWITYVVFLLLTKSIPQTSNLFGTKIFDIVPKQCELFEISTFVQSPTHLELSWNIILKLRL